MTDLNEDCECSDRDSIRVPSEHRRLTNYDGSSALTGYDRCGTFGGWNLFCI
jgi:hypothetical protein